MVEITKNVLKTTARVLLKKVLSQIVQLFIVPDVKNKKLTLIY